MGDTGKAKEMQDDNDREFHRSPLTAIESYLPSISCTPRAPRVFPVVKTLVRTGETRSNLETRPTN